MILGSGAPISDFWPFFRFSILEISANSEKTCFSCCRFFRKIEEMGVYFGGCALTFFHKNVLTYRSSGIERMEIGGQLVELYRILCVYFVRARKDFIYCFSNIRNGKEFFKHKAACETSEKILVMTQQQSKDQSVPVESPIR